MPKITLAAIQAAAARQLRAECARRDAIRLIEDGFVADTTKDRTYLEEVRLAHQDLTLVEASEVAAGHLACQLLAVWYRDKPLEYPEGRTDVEAIAWARKQVAKRFRRGRCSHCRGPALPCARRAASGHDGCAG